MHGDYIMNINERRKIKLDKPIVIWYDVIIKQTFMKEKHSE